MIENQEEEEGDVEETIDSQEEQTEGNLEFQVLGKEGRLDNLDLIDKEEVSVNQETLDNLEQVDKEGSLDRGNQEHLE